MLHCNQDFTHTNCHFDFGKIRQTLREAVRCHHLLCQNSFLLNVFIYIIYFKRNNFLYNLFQHSQKNVYMCVLLFNYSFATTSFQFKITVKLQQTLYVGNKTLKAEEGNDIILLSLAKSGIWLQQRLIKKVHLS